MSALAVWKGQSGWEELTADPPDDVKGRAAYIVGKRLLRLGQVGKAEMAFRTSLNLAPEGSLWSDLCVQRLEAIGRQN